MSNKEAGNQMPGFEGQIHLLFAGFVPILRRVVKVIADATALHTPAILHEVALRAVNAPVSTRPFKARQTQGTENLRSSCMMGCFSPSL